MMHSFFVEGHPSPQGSKSRGRNGQLYEASKRNKAWRATVTAQAIEERNDASVPPFPRPVYDSPVELCLKFRMPRPKKHFVGGNPESGKLVKGAPIFHSTTPDLDKLVRCDSLTAAKWLSDDRIVASISAKKVYVSHNDPIGVYVGISQT